MIESIIIIALSAAVILLARMVWQERKYSAHYQTLLKVSNDLNTDSTARFIELTAQVNNLVAHQKQAADAYTSIIYKQAQTIDMLNAERSVHDVALQKYLKQKQEQFKPRSPFD